MQEHIRKVALHKLWHGWFGLWDGYCGQWEAPSNVANCAGNFLAKMVDWGNKDQLEGISHGSSL